MNDRLEYRRSLGLPKEPPEEWKCAGCGVSGPDRFRRCECPTNVVVMQCSDGRTFTEWKEAMPDHTVFSIPDRDLLERAVRNARSSYPYRRGQKHPRWVAVMETFALGSTFAHQLCRRFDLDPDEEVKA